MKYKTPLVRSIVIISIILVSVLVGVIYDAVWHGIDRGSYPRDYSEYVERYAEQYGVPEYVIYGVIKYESDFDAGKHSEDGGARLMGLSESEFDYLQRLTKTSLDSDSRYGPETSIKYGTYYLAHLHSAFGSWKAVYAAKTVPVESWQAWLDDSANLGEGGALENIPDEAAASRAEKIRQTVQKYRDMYYE